MDTSTVTITNASGTLWSAPKLGAVSRVSAPDTQQLLSVSSVVLVATDQKGRQNQLASAPYSEFTSYVGSLRDSFEVAKRIVRSLRRNEKYLELYLEFVQGASAQDDFERAAGDLAVKPRSIPSEQALVEMAIASELCGEGTLDSDQLSLMLDLDTIEVEGILSAHDRARTQTFAIG